MPERLNVRAVGSVNWRLSVAWSIVVSRVITMASGCCNERVPSAPSSVSGMRIVSVTRTGGAFAVSLATRISVKPTEFCARAVRAPPSGTPLKEIAKLENVRRGKWTT